MDSEKSPYAIVTLYLGEKYGSIANITLPIIKEYASRIGGDLLEITEPKLNAGMGHYEKLQIYDFFEAYERIAFLDIDTLITPLCPNLFLEVPDHFFAAFDVKKYSKIHDKSMRLIQEVLGFIDWDETYFNSGVMVASKMHREIFNPNNGLLDLGINHRFGHSGRTVCLLSKV